MRAKEFIIERELAKRSSDVLVTTKAYPSMPSANPYEIYRFGVSMANHGQADNDGPTSNWAVISSYTPEEEEIVAAAERKTGHKGQLVADKTSHEPGSTNTVSPVAKKKTNKYGV
jgi:hypothetical protein